MVVLVVLKSTKVRHVLPETQPRADVVAPMIGITFQEQKSCQQCFWLEVPYWLRSIEEGSAWLMPWALQQVAIVIVSFPPPERRKMTVALSTLMIRRAVAVSVRDAGGRCRYRCRGHRRFGGISLLSWTVIWTTARALHLLLQEWCIT